MKIHEHSFKTLVEHMKNTIVNDYRIEINEILESPSEKYIDAVKQDNGTVYNFSVKALFLGTDSNGLKSVFGCNFMVSGYLSNKEYQWQLDCDYLTTLVDTPVESITNFKVVNLLSSREDKQINWNCPHKEDLGVNPNIRRQSIIDVVYKKYSDGAFRMLYQPKESCCGFVLYYLELKPTEKEWEIEKRIEVDEIIQCGGKLYVHPFIDGPEEDYEESPYFRINADFEEMGIISNKIKEFISNSEDYDATVATNYKYGSIVSNGDDFIVYEVDGEYRLVLNMEIANCEDISEMLHINNYYKLGINKKVVGIKPVHYGYFWNGFKQCDEFKDDKLFVRRFGNESSMNYDRKPTDINDFGIEDFFIITMEDGSFDFLFVNSVENHNQDSNSSGAYTKTITYVSPRNNQ